MAGTDSTVRKEILFIINPISGTGRHAEVEKIIHEELDPSKFNSRIVYTDAAGEATVLCKEAVEKGVDVIVAVGDGCKRRHGHPNPHQGCTRTR